MDHRKLIRAARDPCARYPRVTRTE